ncbi:flagellar export protein FliJ [Marinobacterium rhizophilum]|uniref:Flagellar FliJ protein n=1 Tax=Marinobacterium rhizophilum TaxID=420402 RepID=A0ABY5HDT8_9GAMM|nr:flagellar export protein FliJ [Marinobacterium rhizophilum]UTW10031.1 flagellar export protein FliJ [Marinobacterium rhizophilum]
MKKRSQRMALLQDLAQRKKREADQFLADSQARVTQGEATLKQLEQFLVEYQQQFQQQGQGGMAVGQMLASRAFIEKIESSIRQHRETMKTHAEQLRQVEQYWRQVYGHQCAMKNLTERALGQERSEAEKQLQKELDERSQRLRPPFI